MTKLTQWLSILLPLASMWTASAYYMLRDEGLTSVVKQSLVNQIVIASPFILLVTFGVYAASVVLWRTFNFNDCKEAAEELQKEIKEAKKFLLAKGVIDK